MNRRTFFNGLGAAIIGTAIVLRLPSSISGIEGIFRKPEITFTALMDAYRKCCVGNKEPKQIVLHPKNFVRVVELISEYAQFKQQLPFVNENGFPKFMGAEVVPSTYGMHGRLVEAFGFGEIKEDEIYVHGDYYGTIGTFRFI